MIDNGSKEVVNTLSSTTNNTTVATNNIKNNNNTSDDVCNWAQCENSFCQKWRKVPSNVDLDALSNRKNKFVCQHINGVSCNTPEDDWTDNDVTVTAASSTNNKYKSKAPRNTTSIEVYRGKPIEPLDDIDTESFPDGWIKLITKRTSGKLIGKLDPYWLTPKMKYRLRSMVEVKKFLIALEYCKGDEVVAKMNMKKMKMLKRKTERATTRIKKTKKDPSITTTGAAAVEKVKNDDTTTTKKRKYWISPFVSSSTENSQLSLSTIESIKEEVAVGRKMIKTGITTTKESKLVRPSNDVNHCNNVNVYNNDCISHDYMSLYGPIAFQQEHDGIEQQEQELRINQEKSKVNDDDDIPSSSVPSITRLYVSEEEISINRNIDDDDFIAHDYVSLYGKVLLQQEAVDDKLYITQSKTKSKMK